MAECSLGDMTCVAGTSLPELADDAIGNLAKAIMEGMSQMVTTLSTFWVSMPTVNLASPGRGQRRVPWSGIVN